VTVAYRGWRDGWRGRMAGRQTVGPAAWAALGGRGFRLHRPSPDQ